MKVKDHLVIINLSSGYQNTDKCGSRFHRQYGQTWLSDIIKADKCGSFYRHNGQTWLGIDGFVLETG